MIGGISSKLTNRTNLWFPLPSILVSGKRVLRAIMMEVVFEALPPCVEIPPACGLVKPKSFASALVVVFSITESAGET